MKIKNYIKPLFYLAVVGTSVFLLFFVITCVWIGYEINSVCHRAVQDYPILEKSDCTDSLIRLLKDEKRDFHSRNDAIWALGELGERKTLPVLQSFYTGKIPAREPLNKTISQYELKKAIVLTSGGLNISAWVWRNMSKSY
jgi:hypothetical protein